MNTKPDSETKMAPPVGSGAWFGGIYQEVDGFYYFNRLGTYAAHTLREIADTLDKMNQPWADQIDRELNPPNPSSATGREQPNA